MRPRSAFSTPFAVAAHLEQIRAKLDAVRSLLEALYIPQELACI